MPHTVFRFMDARTLTNLVAGNWASFETDLESDEPFESDGLLAVEIPYVRFSADRDTEEATARCRGGIVTIDIESLAEEDDYARDGDTVYVMADALVGAAVTIDLKP